MRNGFVRLDSVKQIGTDHIIGGGPVLGFLDAGNGLEEALVKGKL